MDYDYFMMTACQTTSQKPKNVYPGQIKLHSKQPLLTPEQFGRAMNVQEARALLHCAHTGRWPCAFQQHLIREENGAGLLIIWSYCGTLVFGSLLVIGR